MPPFVGFLGLLGSSIGVTKKTKKTDREVAWIRRNDQRPLRFDNSGQCPPALGADGQGAHLAGLRACYCLADNSPEALWWPPLSRHF